tara:strand:+ start:706 stop:1410 length:705 start_codon:yes stop_codon:yes gene_type:complete
MNNQDNETNQLLKSEVKNDDNETRIPELVGDETYNPISELAKTSDKTFNDKKDKMQVVTRSKTRKNVSNDKDTSKGSQNNTRKAKSNNNTKVNTEKTNKETSSSISTIKKDNSNATATNDINLDLLNDDPTNTNPTPKAIVEDKKQLNVNENDNDNENVNKNVTNKTVCLMIQYDYNNPSDSKIKFCNSKTNIQGGKTQKKEKISKSFKRKGIQKKRNLKISKKIYPRRKSVRK